jgi:hypothetical protein
MMRCIEMNAIRAIFMDDLRSSSIKAGRVAAALATGVMALSLMFVLPIVPPLQHAGAGASVHAKNGATPDWILELQTRNAGQSPVTVQNDEPTFWI